jgi:7-cyano-7-deazaguanine synthase
MKKAVILLSGGLDSATCLAIAEAEGFDCYTIGFDYGQRHRHEIECAQQLSPNHKVITIPNFGGSALTDHNIAVPKDGLKPEIPVTYVPARNAIFLAFALGYAEVLGATDIFIGVNALDYSGYPDCRPEFIEAFQNMANLGTKAGNFRINTPLINLTKAQIITLGSSLGVNYGHTTSCYDPVGHKACGTCDSCRLRLKGFAEAGLNDPVEYV